MKQKKMKWKCHGCGAEFATKKECEKHIKKTHWDYINRTAGLGSFKYRCVKIEQPLEESHWDRIGREQEEQLRIQERMTGSPDPILAPFKSFKMPAGMTLQKTKTKKKKKKVSKQRTLLYEVL